MTVADWGSGRPDYYSPTISSRPALVSEEQEQWTLNKVYNIAGFASSLDAFYTVPADFDLVLGGGYISCNNSVINKLRILSGSTIIIGDFRYDMRADIILTSLSGQNVPTETVLNVYLWNNANIESEISVTLSGILERVRT